jgi:hypothetical protein
MLCRVSLVSASIVVAATARTAELGRDALTVSVNGVVATASAPYYAVYPGRANRLSIRADFAVLKRGALAATLFRALPDGRADMTTAQLAPDAPEAVFDLGAFAVPAEYDYEDGVVCRRGVRFRLTVADERTGHLLAVLGFYQGPARAADSEALWAGEVQRYVYDGGYDSGRGWRPNEESGAPMDPPFLLRLDPAVLANPDEVHVMFRQKDGLGLAPVRAEMVITRLSDGKNIHRRPAVIGADWHTEKVSVRRYDEGDYRITLAPAIEGTQDREGPCIVYHRRSHGEKEVRVSPLAPWTLERDPAREELLISDFRRAVERWGAGAPDPRKWDVGEQLLGRGDIWADPVLLRPGLQGPYAVFAKAVRKCYVAAGGDSIVRQVGGAGEPFLVAADMTDGQVAIYQSGTSGDGLASLRFVPVTAGSVEALEAETSHPPTCLAGVADWIDFFAHSGGDCRLAEDQFALLVKGHAELGMRELQWSVGRSWVWYWSNLPETTRWPCIPLDEVDPGLLAQYPHWTAWDYVMKHYCPLTEAEKYAAMYEVRLWPWLAMQRHYGKSYGGVFASKWYREHPQWWRWRKHATGPDWGEVCYFFPEVRKERVDILCEVAQRSPEGLLVDCCRQVPMLLYHPEMCAAYKEKTGIDPKTLDASAGKAYEDWIRWRADFFTETLRELKVRLAPIRERTGRPIPVAVRIPSAGLFYNMAQGLDIETWCREGLVDVLQVEPLEDRGGQGSHDIRPYLDLGRRYGIPIFGGINGNTWSNFTVIMKRALGLLEAGVDGIEIYESNNFCVMEDRRWIIPLLGNRQRLADFLATSNIEACYPVWATNACAGFDNHSFGSRWSIYEGQGTPL